MIEILSTEDDESSLRSVEELQSSTDSQNDHRSSTEEAGSVRDLPSSSVQTGTLLRDTGIIHFRSTCKSLIREQKPCEDKILKIDVPFLPNSPIEFSQNEYIKIMDNFVKEESNHMIKNYPMNIVKFLNRRQLGKIKSYESTEYDHELEAKAILFVFFALDYFIVYNYNSLFYRPNKELFDKCKEYAKHILVGKPISKNIKNEIEIVHGRCHPKDFSYNYYSDFIDEELIFYTLSNHPNDLTTGPIWLEELLNRINYYEIISNIYEEREGEFYSEVFQNDVRNMGMEAGAFTLQDLIPN